MFGRSGGAVFSKNSKMNTRFFSNTSTVASLPGVVISNSHIVCEHMAAYCLLGSSRFPSRMALWITKKNLTKASWVFVASNKWVRISVLLFELLSCPVYSRPRLLGGTQFNFSPSGCQVMIRRRRTQTDGMTRGQSSGAHSRHWDINFNSPSVHAAHPHSLGQGSHFTPPHASEISRS